MEMSKTSCWEWQVGDISNSLTILLVQCLILLWTICRIYSALSLVIHGWIRQKVMRLFDVSSLGTLFEILMLGIVRLAMTIYGHTDAILFWNIISSDHCGSVLDYSVNDAGFKLCGCIIVACDENRGRCILDACCPLGKCFSEWLLYW